MMPLPTNRCRRARSGFTLIEVLATVRLMAIALPAIMNGITLATGAGAAADKRAQGAGLAEEKLNEVLAGQLWESGQLAGDFPDAPGFQWQGTLQNWSYDTTDVGLQELDLRVTWDWRNRQESVQLSTLVYVRNQQSSTSTP
jgi:prepilin-type N-terminal cleavage/methylation domain-containing protein